MAFNHPVFSGHYDLKTGETYIYFKEDGVKKKAKINFIEPYFYIRSEDVGKIRALLTRWEKSKWVTGIKRSISGKYIKITLSRYSYHTHSPIFKELAANKVLTYEADLNPLKLYRLDNELEIETKYDFLYFDIETDDSGKVIDPTKYPVLSVAWYSSKEERYGFLTDKDERKLLENFIEVMKTHDVLIGWNSDAFDIEYLKVRMDHYGINFDWKTVHSIDLMYEFKDHIRSGIDSYSLDNISKRFLGEKKVERTKKVKELFDTDLVALKDYNVHDVTLLKMLEDKFGFAKLKIELCIYARVPLSDGYRTEIIDSLLLRKARKKDLHLKSSFEIELDHKILGGRIIKPITGYHEDVSVFDFKSLYPSIIRTFNISPETKMTEPPYHNCCKALNRIDEDGEEKREDIPHCFFSKDVVGIIPELCAETLDKREELKKKKKEAKETGDTEKYEVYAKQEGVMKVINNAIYGMLGNVKCRYYDSQLANSVTGAGRFLNKQTMVYFNNQSYKVVGGHTDSAMAVIPRDKIQSELEELGKLYQKLLEDRGCPRHYTKILHETTFKQMLYIETSRYVGVNDDGSWKVVGIEMINSKTIPYTKRKMKELLTMIFAKKSLTDVRLFVLETKGDVVEGKVPVEDVIISQKLNKHPDEYKTKLIHILLADKAMKAGKEMYVGQKIRYVITDFYSKDKTNRAVLEEDYSSGYDKVYYWETQIYRPLMRLLECAYPEEDWKSYESVKATTTGEGS